MNLLRTADETSWEMGYDIEEVADCIRCLTALDYYKTIPYPNEQNPKLHYDVYKTRHMHRYRLEESNIYLKLRLTDGPRIWVGSFKPL